MTPGACGQVLAEAMPSHSLHQKVCSKNSGWMPELVDVDVVEDLLGVVGAVVVADAGVVAADDEVGAAVVPADDRVEDRLARARRSASSPG